MRRSLTLLVSTMLTVALLAAGSLASASPAVAATIAPTTTCSNGVDDTPGLGLICEVTVINTVTASGGSATVTVRECHGAAGNPTAACTTTTMSLSGPVTAVNQCNDATNGGGGTLRCSVSVTTNIQGSRPTSTAATVNQCVGSGGGITTGCTPFPATTTGASITQCNGSANGGTLVGLTCTATGRTAAGYAVAINQCNNSTNGGGALVICSATLAVNAVTPSPSPTPSVTPSATPSATSTSSVRLPETSTLAEAGGPAGSPFGGLLAILIGLMATVGVALVRHRLRRWQAPRDRASRH